MQRHRKRACFAVLTVLALGIWPSTSSANGRFPGATQLVLRGERGVLASSFGLITTSDRFANPAWSCEKALGYDPTQNNDLGTGIFGDGTIVLSGPEGLSISTDLTCTNPKPNGPIGDLWFADVTIDGQNPSHGLAVSRGPQRAECGGGQLFESVDNGRSWATLAALPQGFCPFTVDSAPSDASRIYVSGNVLDTDGSRLLARLLVSSDRGATWASYDIPNEARPFIGAIDPLDRDTLYVRTTNPPSSGRLLVSTDAGKSFREIATLTGLPLQFFGVTGIAVSPDGSKLAYGSLNEGLFILDKNGGAPEKRSDLPVMCLAWGADGLYACSAPNLCGPFFVGVSRDEGRSFEAVLPTLDVGGDQTQCPSTTPRATLCSSEDWRTLRKNFGGCTDGGAGPVDAGAADAGAAPRPPKLGDCDCRFVGGAGTSAPLPGALAVVAFTVLRRRRARGRSA